MAVVRTRHRELTTLLSSEQEGALRNLLQGLVAREVAEKLHAAGDLIGRINRRLDEVRTTQGIGVSVRWRRRDGLDPDLATMVDLLSRPPDLRTVEQDQVLRAALSARLDQARRDDPDAAYRDLIGLVLDYRSWHEITLLLHRPGRGPERLTRRTALSEGEKKIVSYLPLFAAVAASCDSLAETAADTPRFLLLDDAFAKVSEDNHPKLFGLLVEFDLDFIVTSERLWGTHRTVPELAITEVIRDAGLGVIVLEHSRWDGAARNGINIGRLWRYSPGLSFRSSRPMRCSSGWRPGARSSIQPRSAIGWRACAGGATSRFRRRQVRRAAWPTITNGGTAT
jgi:hypothetical protein